MLSEDVRRELQKIKEALDAAVAHHTKQNEANAALHLSANVLYSPLTVKLQTAQHSVSRLITASHEDRIPSWTKEEIASAQAEYEKTPKTRRMSDDSYSRFEMPVPWSDLTVGEREYWLRRVKDV